jgi:hypothetical protein
MDYIVATPSGSAEPSLPSAVVLDSPLRQETFGRLTPAARTEFTDGLIAELRRQIDDKCFPGSIAAGIVALIALARFSIPEFGQKYGLIFAFAVAFVLASIVFKIAKATLEGKYVRPIADISDEMLVTRYNEAKADRRAARRWIAISWGVIAIIALVLVVGWMAARR